MITPSDNTSGPDIPPAAKCNGVSNGTSNGTSPAAGAALARLAGRLSSLETLPVRAAILDANGIIAEVNEAWKEFGRQTGLATRDFGIGCYYLQFCDWSDARSRLLQDELQDLLHGRLDILTHAYPCHSPQERRWFVMLAVPVSRERREGAVVLHIDVSGLLPLEAVDEHSLKLRETRPAPTMLDAIADVVRHSVRESVLNLVGPNSRAEPAPADDGLSEKQLQAQARLSPRQREVFALLGKGKTNLEIAQALSVSPNTVKLHVSAILRRLDIDSRTQAALIAAKLPPLSS